MDRGSNWKHRLIIGAFSFMVGSAVGCGFDRQSDGPPPSVQERVGVGTESKTERTPAPIRDTTAATVSDSNVVAAGASGSVTPEGESIAAASHDAPPGDFPPLFVGWPKPVLALFLTGRQHGYIEPCGCTGLAHAKGGLSRRRTLALQLQQRGWNVVPLDVGNQVRRFGRQAELKFQASLDVLKMMDYRAVAFGPDDLRLSVDELIAAAAGIGGQDGPFVCANVNLFDLTARFRVIDAGGKKVGVTSVLGAEEQKRINSAEIELEAPADALRRIVPELRSASCDVYVLLSHASLEETKQLAAQFPLFHLVVTAGGAEEPTLEPENIEGTNAKLIQVGAKGMYVGVVGVYDDPQTPLRYQRVPLDARFGDSRDVLDRFASYQQQLEVLGLEGLGLSPIPHPSGRAFVGSSTCAECHTTAFAKFKTTPHFRATDGIAHPTERSEIPRHFDPECLSCHVTGWNPQEFFPYVSGYLDFENSKNLHGNGCENCHGPGSDHVAAEMGEVDLTDDQIEQRRQQMRLRLDDAEQKCLECHDLDNDPHFHEKGAFEEYWKKIEHYGKD